MNVSTLGIAQNWTRPHSRWRVLLRLILLTDKQPEINEFSPTCFHPPSLWVNQLLRLVCRVAHCSICMTKCLGSAAIQARVLRRRHGITQVMRNKIHCHDYYYNTYTELFRRWTHTYMIPQRRQNSLVKKGKTRDTTTTTTTNTVISKNTTSENHP